MNRAMIRAQQNDGEKSAGVTFVRGSRSRGHDARWPGQLPATQLGRVRAALRHLPVVATALHVTRRDLEKQLDLKID